ncbi:hypothetical protein QVD17_23719 [Tagetes erecta]|uniref:BHLH domain-containing protein n=1 Tax=Tagetes erecta TaxID=13708 RepID=A0AAD8KES0_TARER|nr:hypothetical protein QVD17_23719 [Tagetes erecta]
MERNAYHPVTKARKLNRDQSPSSKPNSATSADQGVKDHEDTQRKRVHREIERQRRQDMAKLYASLRGLLPLEFLKGKRSTSDHMHQAVNYIKHMQENIRLLSVKRDRLKKLVETSVSIHGTNTKEKRLMNLCPNTLSVRSCDGEGIQILINSCSLEDGFPLSKVIDAISNDFNVVTYTCSKVNQRLIHSIQTEANDSVSTDYSMLEQRLAAIINNY